jgi:hypothetical protein
MHRALTRGAILLVVGLSALGLTACNKYGLTGHIDGTFDAIDGTTVVGWANAADPAFSNADWTTVVFVDKKLTPVTTSEWTNRPDVVTAVGPNSWGFQATVQDLTFGPHELCVDIVPKADAATATAESFLECSEIFVPQHGSLARIGEATVTGTDLDLSGWVYTSPYQPEGPWGPALFIDDAVYEADFVAGEYPEVSSFLKADPQSVAGLDVTIPFDPGTHEVCLGVASSPEEEAAEFIPLECVDVVV